VIPSIGSRNRQVNVHFLNTAKPTRLRSTGRKTKIRRQSHGSAWHWKQTDAWYYTQPGTKKRFPLFDQDGERIRGKQNKEAADIALVREKLTWADESAILPNAAGEWLVADDVEDSERGMMWGVYSSKTRKTRKIPVRPEVADLTRKLMQSAPRNSGIVLFRNTQGKETIEEPARMLFEA
jgi:hypothetical protein